jgi:hypothetical protein
MPRFQREILPCNRPPTTESTIPPAPPSMIVSVVLGAVCLFAFCFLQSFVSIYRARLVRRRQGWTSMAGGSQRRGIGQPPQPRGLLVLAVMQGQPHVQQRGSVSSAHAGAAQRATLVYRKRHQHRPAPCANPALRQLCPQVAVKPPTARRKGVLKYM